MEKKQFAEIIGISYNNYYSLKNKGTRAKILKTEKIEETRKEEKGTRAKKLKTEQIEETRKEEIREELIKKGYRNKAIDYVEFLELYKPYENEMEEKQFAEIIGISYGNYQSLKNKGTRAKINFIRSYIVRINYEFRESRFYDEEYFTKIADKYGCSVEDIIEILYDLKDDNQLIYRTLKEKEKLYVGEKKISEEFMKKHLEYLYNKFRRYSHIIGKRLHTTLYEEDIIQDVMIVLISSKGDIVENLNETDAEKALMKYGITLIKYQHLSKLQIRTISLDETLGEKDNRTRYYKVKAPSNFSENPEESILKKGDEDFTRETPIEAMKYYIKKGLERTEILKLVAQEFNLTQRELLEKLEEELKSRIKIRTTANGQVYLGEEI